MRCRHLLIFLLPVLLVACHATPSRPAGASSYGQISNSELRGLLADMARAHEQKIQLALYANFPFFSVDKPFQPFYANMGKSQGDLLEELRGWADGHSVDLTWHRSTDTTGDALAVMEDRQEKIIRADDRAGPDFPRDTLIQMYTDYEWQISVIQALLPKITDPDLKRYLQNSLKVHEAGSAEITALLKRFKFTN